MNDIEKSVLINLARSRENCGLFESRGFSSDLLQFPESRNLCAIILYYHSSYSEPLQADSVQLLLSQAKTFSDEMKRSIFSLFVEIGTLPSVSNFSLLLDQFMGYYKFERVRGVIDKAINQLQDKDPDKAILGMTDGLSKIQRIMTPSTSITGYLGDTADKQMDLYEDQILHPERYQGILIGFPSIDAATNGLKPRTLTILAGVTGDGKSVVAVNIARAALLKGKRVYYHSNEVYKDMIEKRFISCDSGLVMDQIERATLSPEDKARYAEAWKKWGNTNMLLIDEASPADSSVEYIDKKLMEVGAFWKPDLIIVDHIGLMEAGRWIDSSSERLGLIARDLATLAKQHNVPVFVISHVNREAMRKAVNEQKKYFTLDDLGLSIEHAKRADLVLSWRIAEPELYARTNQGLAYLAIIKSRGTRKAISAIRFNSNVMKAEEPEMRLGLG